MASASDKELERQLMEAGNRLLDPPSEVDELLILLHQAENYLSKVEQSPSQSMQNALSPSLKALVAEQLFRHPDADVKVAVAACISEITRITAPDAPYDDEQMKEIFQLIVSSFENLSDKSSCSYEKRTAILETVAKVRSCVVMLDLECDALIVQMFQHFLKSIRDYHSDNVFSSMETIMTLVLEESEDISVELLSPLLDSVKKDNEDVLPIARKLVENVLERCATKLKPYLAQAVETLGFSLDDYCKVVASICEETSDPVEQDGDAAIKNVPESQPAGAVLNDATQDNKESSREVSAGQGDIANDKPPSSAVSNGVTETKEDDSNLQKQEHEHEHLADQSKNNDLSSTVDSNTSCTKNTINLECNPKEPAKKRGRKPSSSRLTEPSDSSKVDEMEVETLPEPKSDSKDIHGSPHVEQSVDADISSEDKKGIGVQPSSPKVTEDESADVGSPTPSGSLPDESNPRKGGRSKRKESLIKEASTSVDDLSKKASEGLSDSEAKPSRRSGKKAASGISDEDKTLTVIDETKKESGAGSDSEAKPLKQSAKKDNGDGSSSKQQEDKKKRSRGKGASGKEGSKTSTKNDDNDMVVSPKSMKPSKDEAPMEETPKTNSKRKHAPGKPSNSIEYGENLVGSKIKVWWPKDRMFYKGVIDSFDSVKKKHKVLYDDGDEENLVLKRQRWEFMGDDSGSDEEGAVDHPSPDASSDEMPPKKKAKTTDQSTKQAKADAPLRKGGGSSSSKSKGVATKAGRKLKEDGKVDSNLGKTKDHTPKSGSRSVDVASKAAGKSKNYDSDTPKSSKSEDGVSMPKASKKLKQDSSKTAKSKQETPNFSGPKGKPIKNSRMSSANGSGKSKSGSSKVKEGENMKENSTDSPKVETAKGKVPSSSKTGKKRRR